MVAAKSQVEDKMAQLEAERVSLHKRSPASALRSAKLSQAPKAKSSVQFVKAGGAEANRDEISIDDDEEATEDTTQVEEKAVPAAVFGSINTDAVMGAKARFQAKKQ